MLGIVLLVAMIFFPGPPGHCDTLGPEGLVLHYTGKKLGVSILKATIQIENGTIDGGKSLYKIHANISSLGVFGLLFRMNNRFTSLIESGTCRPIHYVKEIDQQGIFIGKKRYVHRLHFDTSHGKAIIEKDGEKGREEISIPPDTYDPLSLFGRYCLEEDIQAGQEFRMSIYDGMKLREVIFHSSEADVESKAAVCLESVTPFSTFGGKEGRIRIWFTRNDRKRIPILIELDLPVGMVRFELEETREK